MSSYFLIAFVVAIVLFSFPNALDVIAKPFLSMVHFMEQRYNRAKQKVENEGGLQAKFESAFWKSIGYFLIFLLVAPFGIGWIFGRNALKDFLSRIFS